MNSPSQLQLFFLGLDLSLANAVKSRILQAGLAKSTLRNYRSGWKSFESWCRATGNPSLPATPETCIDHAAWCISENLRLETVTHRLKAINFYHQQNDFAKPADKTVLSFMRNARRDLCERPQGKLALTPAHLRKLSTALLRRKSNMDIRDRAMILLCFAAGWRCSELVSLDVEDVRWMEKGIVLWLGKSKTDQEGKGRSVGIHFGRRNAMCPVEAVQQWLSIRGDWSGPLFTSLRSNQAIAQRRLHQDGVRSALKRALDLIGENSKPYGAHSLRSGMITSAIESGATETAVMQRTGQRRYETLRRYVRPAVVFRANPMKGVL